MSTRKFFKQTIRIEVLSEDAPIDDGADLEFVAYAITQGDCSGEVKWDDPIELSGPEAAIALVAQGSDPEFFQLDDDGNDLSSR